MKEYRLHWVCLTGAGLGQWKVIEEFHGSEELCRAVLEGFGPKPQAWWEVSLMKVHKNLLCSQVAHVQRKRKDAEAELPTQSAEVA